MARRSNQPEEVFKFVRIPPDGSPDVCWPWEGALGGSDDRGYFSTKGVKWLAYRLIYTLVYGEIPEGQVVRHKCDNKLCCNPHHLELGTQSDNEHDKYDRNRYGFPLEAIKRIMHYHKEGLTQEVIATVVTAECGVVVTQQRVSDIVSGKRRKKQTDEMKGQDDE